MEKNPQIDECKGRPLILDDIMRVGRMAYSKGFLAGCSGNISARDPGGLIYITASGTCKGMLGPEDILCCDLYGEPVGATHGRKVSSEIKLHTYIYRYRKDIAAVIHAHPVFSIAASLAGIDFSDPLLPETILSLGAVEIAEYGTPTTEELVLSIKTHIQAGLANIILKRHGTLNIAQSLNSALANLETLEHVAKIAILARMLDCDDPLDRDEMKKLNAIRGGLFA